MTDDQFWLRAIPVRVVGSSRECQQDAPLTQLFANGNCFGGRDDQPRRSTSEQASDFAEASRAGDKNLIPNSAISLAPNRRDAPHRLVARNQGIAHSWERRHST